jgi:hypothetical protein
MTLLDLISSNGILTLIGPQRNKVILVLVKIAQSQLANQDNRLAGFDHRTVQIKRELVNI